MLWNIAVNDTGAEYDPLTLLRTRTMFGRPDWNSIYSRMKGAIQNGSYLPGSTSQLSTKVAVRHIYFMNYMYDCLNDILTDLFLWSSCNR